MVDDAHVERAGEPYTLDGLDELARLHVQHLIRQQTKAPNTITSRIRVLRSIGNPGTIGREELEEWYAERADLASGTRAVDLSHVRAFYKWCQVWEHRADDPSVRIEAPHVGNRLPKRAKAHELTALLKALDDEPDLQRAVMLGAYAGFRVSESAALDWRQVDSDDATLTVLRSKRDKSRVVDVSPVLLDMLGEPMAEGNVLTRSSRVYSAQQLQRRLNRAIRAAGLDITTHSLRHRYGVAAYQATGDLLALAELMGHGSINTTKIYAAASTEVKRRIAAAVMR